jgi:hypothetical protein
MEIWRLLVVLFLIQKLPAELVGESGRKLKKNGQWRVPGYLQLLFRRVPELLVDEVQKYTGDWELEEDMSGMGEAECRQKTEKGVVSWECDEYWEVCTKTCPSKVECEVTCQRKVKKETPALGVIKPVREDPKDAKALTKTPLPLKLIAESTASGAKTGDETLPSKALDALKTANTTALITLNNQTKNDSGSDVLVPKNRTDSESLIPQNGSEVTSVTVNFTNKIALPDLPDLSAPKNNSMADTQNVTSDNNLTQSMTTPSDYLKKSGNPLPETSKDSQSDLAKVLLPQPKAPNLPPTELATPDTVEGVVKDQEERDDKIRNEVTDQFDKNEAAERFQ